MLSKIALTFAPPPKASKIPLLASYLSYQLPGAGLAYIGRWSLGFLNLGIVILMGYLADAFLIGHTFDNHKEILRLGCTAASSWLAFYCASRVNTSKDDFVA